MYIGIDFHGVVTDTAAHKQHHAAEMFGIELAPELCTREAILGSGSLTLDQYSQLLREIYFTRKALEAPPQGDSVVALTHLSSEHPLHIVTGSDDEEMPFIKEWLAAHDLGQIALSTAGYRGSKYVDNFDVFVDDKPKVLQRLRPFIAKLFLFDQPYNKNVELGSGTGRIKSLYELEA